MQLIRQQRSMREAASIFRSKGERIAIVPTMGSLHEGHLRLVKEAGEHADRVVVSIYVNPTQFGEGEDYEGYPRELERDLEKIEALGGVDVVYAPTTAEMYSANDRTWVTVERLDEHLCGGTRPGHFRGVTTVVARLFIHCLPHVGIFGLKDAQQFFILRRMTEDMGFGVRLIGVPTVRETDGLALSSRNAYLSPQERKQAVVLSRAVRTAERLVKEGEQESEAIVAAMLKCVNEAPLASAQYVAVVDTGLLQPIGRIEPGQEVLAALAVFFGHTRLIDNCIVRAPADGSSVDAEAAG